MTLSYHEKPTTDFLIGDSLEALQRQIFAKYVQIMLDRRSIKTRYKREQTERYLAWLAKQLAQHNLTMFERTHLVRNTNSDFQEDWLPNIQLRQLYRGITSGMISGVSGILLGTLIGTLLGWLIGVPANPVLNELLNVGIRLYSLVFPVFMGTMAISIVFGLFADIPDTWPRRGVVTWLHGLFEIIGLLLIGFFSLTLGQLYFMLPFGLVAGLLSGWFSTLISVLVIILVGLLVAVLAIRPAADRNDDPDNITYLTMPLSGLVGVLAGGLVGGLDSGGWWIVLQVITAIILALSFHSGIQRQILRLLLLRAGCIPWNYLKFLDYAAERILLREVANGYIFFHELLQQYYANLDTSSGSQAKSQLADLD